MTGSPAPTHPFDAISESDLRIRGGLKWQTTPVGMLPAWVAETDFGAPDTVLAALRDWVSRSEFGYVSPARITDYQDAVSHWYRQRFRTAVTPEHIHPVADVVEAYRRTIENYTPPGSAVIVPTPAYPPLLTVPIALGRRLITIGHTADGSIDLDELETHLTRAPGLVVLCNPHNPLGRVARREELVSLAELVERTQSRVFADEIHSPFVYDGTHIPYASVSASAASHTITAFSASKAFNLASLKAAALITHNDEDLKTWNALGTMASHGASTAGLLAGATALTSGGDWFDEVLRYLHGNRELLTSRLSGCGLHLGVPQGTYLLWADAAAIGVDRPAELLAEHGLRVNDGRDFGPGFDSFLRFNFALPLPLLSAAADRLLHALSSPTTKKGSTS